MIIIIAIIIYRFLRLAFADIAFAITLISPFSSSLRWSLLSLCHYAFAFASWPMIIASYSDAIIYRYAIFAIFFIIIY